MSKIWLNFYSSLTNLIYKYLISYENFENLVYVSFALKIIEKKINNLESTIEM